MNIIDEIFYGNVSGIGNKTSPAYRKACQQEFKQYEKVKSALKEKDMKLVDELLKLSMESVSISEKDFYIQGFKTGLLIGIESTKIDL